MLARVMLVSSVVVAVAVFATAGIDTPEAERRVDRPFYSTTVGSRWVYQDRDYSEWTEELTSIERRGDAILATISDSRTRHWDKIIGITSEGVFINPGRELDSQRHYWLRTPIRTGEQWSSSFVPGGTPRNWESCGWETVQVPAGTFNAVKIRLRLGGKLPSGEWDPMWGPGSYCWFAEDIGLVRQTRGSYELRLMSFRPGS